MRAINTDELNLIAAGLRPLIGAQLQEIVTRERAVGLGLYHLRSIKWIWFDLNPVAPIALPLAEPPPGTNHTKPVLLFLRAHARGKRLSLVDVPQNLGRVLRLVFGAGETNCEIEARLYPHGQNLRVRSQTNQIYFNKPRSLPLASSGFEANSPPETSSRSDAKSQSLTLERSEANPPARGLEALIQEWRQKSPSTVAKAESGARELARRQATLGKMRRHLDELSHQQWAQAGEYLKIYGMPNRVQASEHDDTQVGESGAAPDGAEWLRYMDCDQSLSWNIQRCFARAREVAHKIKGQTQRIQDFERDLESHRIRALARDSAPDGERDPALKTESAGVGANSRQPAPARGPNRKVPDARMRRFVEDGIPILIGKSARDNLALLRAARPWDLWLHLRDYPGAYGIIHREKNQNIPPKILEALSRHLIRHSRAQKILGQSSGERLEVVVAECRYVRPVKSADRVGLVTYRNEKILRVLESSLD